MKEQERYYTFKDFMNFVRTMANSTDLYGRLLRNIEEMEEEELLEFKQYIEDKKFKSDMDIIYWYECE